LITKNTTTLAFASVLLAAFVGGGLGVFTKIGIREIPLFSFIFLRFFLATLFLLPFALKEKLPQKKELLKTVRLSLLSTINVTFAALGLKFTTATIGQLLYTCVPILAAILSYYFLKEKINSRKIVGILTGFHAAR
jgi:drug/metabolite transporter (DMT)-like permease